MTKELSNMILELHYVIIELSNVRKNKGTTKCEKRIVKCDVRTAQYRDGIVKCEKIIREPPNETKELSHVMLELHNVWMETSNVRKKKKKGNHQM